MRLGKDGWWRCHGFDGEGCHLPPQPDQYLIPAEYERWEREISAMSTANCEKRQD
jgi:hypothetical protein